MRKRFFDLNFSLHLVHFVLLLIVVKLDKDLARSTRVEANGEPPDPTYKLLIWSWIALFILLFFLPSSSWRSGWGQRVVNSIPFIWFGLWLFVFRPHS